MTTPRPLGRLHLTRIVLYGVVAVAAVVVSAIYGDLRSVHGRDKVIVIAAGVVFIVAGVAAFHRLASELSRVVRARTGGAAAAAIEVTVSVAGYILVFFVALDLFSVSIQSLLVGGAITGIVLGIALQQILGNVFAGVALLLAHPFNIGDRIMLKTGAYGGEVIGRVVSVSLTYVVLDTDKGILHIPNSGVLASAISTDFPDPPAKVEKAEIPSA